VAKNYLVESAEAKKNKSTKEKNIPHSVHRTGYNCYEKMQHGKIVCLVATRRSGPCKEKEAS